MTFRIRSLSGVALTAAILALQTGAVHAQETVVKVGVAGPLTGGGAAYGKDIENGARMAIDDLNAKGLAIGGRQVKWVLQAETTPAIRRPARRLPRSWSHHRPMSGSGLHR